MTEITIELSDEQIDDIFKKEMNIIYDNLKSDLERRKAGDFYAVFTHDKDDDIKQMEELVDAFDKVMDYCI